MKRPADQLCESVKKRDVAGMHDILRKHPEAAKAPRAVVSAGGMAWQEGLTLLLKHGADINAEWRGYRAMHGLMQEAPHADHGKPSPERIECLKWMLEHGADPELDAAWPPSRALLIAAFTGVPEYIKVLRDAGAKTDGFVYAAVGDLKKVQKALGADKFFAQARTRQNGLTALHCCAASRIESKTKTAVAELLLDHGADRNALCQGWSHELDVAYFASGSGQKDMFELLLKRGADADNALVHAMWQKDLAALGEIALRYGADVNRARYASSCADGDKPLLNQMIRWGQMAATFWLLEKGADPNLPDPRGWTAVHQAASRGNERMLNAVLAAGGNPNRKTLEGHSPIDIARAKNLIRVLKQAARAT